MMKGEVTPKRVRKFLGDLGRAYAKYYEHSAQIASRISGVDPLTMTPEQEENLRVRFRQAQVPFDEMPRCIKGKDRKNFLSYRKVKYTLLGIVMINGGYVVRKVILGVFVFHAIAVPTT